VESITEDVGRLVESVWAAVLDLEVRPGEPGASATGALPGGEDLLTGRVPITGAWEGRVLLACAQALAREAAGRMFGVPPGEVTAEQVHDALGELTNVVGGNVKALLPGMSRLGLPTVAPGGEGAAGPCLLRLTFECRGLPLRVVIEGKGVTPG
jgi:chemotaxis protein CheX